MCNRTVNKAVVLTSGGIDSSTVLAMAAHERREIYSLSLRYGQRHAVELLAAAGVAEAYNVQEHLVLDIDLRAVGGSALTDDIDVPKNKVDVTENHVIPVTYVPARNTIFLSYALAWAEVVGAAELWIGVTAVDYSGYPDCRREYLDAFETMANLATKAGVEGSMVFRIRAPLLEMSKAEIIRAGTALGVDYSMTHSCYDPDPQGRACGSCDSCLLRKKGFVEAGVDDPTVYI